MKSKPSTFQFTHPVWGATAPQSGVNKTDNVSIHAPRVGCDVKCDATDETAKSFNSRTPCGVRRIAGAGILYLA